MKRKNPQVIAFKRRRTGRTNYRKRLKLLISKKTRIVIRTSNKNIYVQIVNFNPKGDKIVTATSSFALKKLGWEYSPSNICAAYLTGLLAGKKAKEKELTECIADLGLKRVSKGNKMFAVMKGLKDSGINILVDEKMLPNNDRVLGKHIITYAEKLKTNQLYEKKFSEYAKNNIAIDQIAKKVEELKIKIIGK
tara:strand:+ start:12618 stop:13196 length:579 start_codon:yes stop_codon:yes gene_type:complete